MVFALGVLGVALFLQTVLESASLSGAYASVPAWMHLVEWLDGRVEPGDLPAATVPLGPRLGGGVLIAALAAWLVGGELLAGSRGGGRREALRGWADCGWRWWLLPGAWWLLFIAALLAGWAPVFLAESSELWLATALSGWVCTWFNLRSFVLPAVAAKQEAPESSPPHPHTPSLPCRPARGAVAILTLALAAYVVTFTALQTGMWLNLRIPHGDSAMYEEHLWNLEHGKGFRSYLDQGLFLGEHIQVIHLLVVPLHLLWPHHLLLEGCASLWLALGAVPVFLLARRHGGSDRAATLLAIAYLLYFPLQYLDVTVDLKTFRPNALGVPAVLWAIERMERGRWWSMAAWLTLALSAQEDYAIVIALLGGWLALVPAAPAEATLAAEAGFLRRLFGREHRPRLWLGAGMLVFGAAYLLLVFKVAFPWFRDGATIHYAGYFAKFGSTPGEIVRTMLMEPGRVVAHVVTMGSVLYALRLLAPLGFLPLLSPARLALGSPLFVLLCLNDLAQQPPAPVHHFHAPLLPFLLWAAAAALHRRAGVSPLNRDEPQVPAPRSTQRAHARRSPVARARFACACAFFTGVFMSITPLGLKFWDHGRTTYWRDLYVPGERTRQFAQIEPLVPATSRVASTDFIHPRFTHYERSYDYSAYLRKVAGYQHGVPDDTGYIVIDVAHPYNTPAQVHALRNDPRRAVRELREQPDRWELLPETGGGYFLVLKRVGGQ